MVITNTAKENTYTGNGSLASYSLTIPFFDTADVKAKLDGVVTTAFTVTPGTLVDGHYNNGTVVFTTAPANGVAILLYCDTPAKQEDVDAGATNSIDVEDVEQALDRSALIARDTRRINEASATEAAASAAAAATSESNAATSAATASAKATEAATSAANAQSSATAAATSAAAALVSESNAATSETNAAASAGSASAIANGTLYTYVESSGTITAVDGGAYSFAASGTVNLPTPAPAVHIRVLLAATTGTITFVRNGSETINQIPSDVSATGAGFYTVACYNGTDWLLTQGEQTGIYAQAQAGADGADGADGVDGADGADGIGIPAGGSAGEVLQKIDGTDYNTQWATVTATESELVQFDIRNTTGSTITAGTPVYISGYATGDGRVLVTPADASSSATMPAVGVIKTDVANNSNGSVVAIGALTNIDTSSFSEGNTVYVASGGGLTNVKPTGTNLIQNIGKVSRSHASNGAIIVTGPGRSNDVPNLPSANLWLGNASGVATPVSISGDATLANTGALTISNKTGADTGIVTGTAGTSGNLVQWNVDGDAVDASIAASDVVTPSSTDTLTNKDLSSTTNTFSNTITTKTVIVKAIADDTALTVADNLTKFVVPVELNGMNLVSVGAHVFTASTSGLPTIQIFNATDSVDMLSTGITIDANEKDSSTATTAAVINTANDDVATGDEIRIDCDVAGTGTTGLEVRLGFRLP